MSVPILAFYLIGLVVFIIGFEETEDRIRGVIYLGLSFFINFIGYTLSYLDTNYIYSAYLPLVIMAFSVILAIYNGWLMIPTKLSWNDKADNEDD